MGNPSHREIRFRCTICAFCCRHYTPLVTAEDARRIQENLAAPLSSFLVFYRPEDFSEPLGPDDRTFLTREGPLVMGLLHQEGACVFLRGNLCSIHAFKPGICRAFPFEPAEPGDVIGLFRLMPSDPCHGNSSDDEIVPQEEVRSQYVPFISDYDSYVALVAAWNADPCCQGRGIEDFLCFVGLDWWRYESPREGG